MAKAGRPKYEPTADNRLEVKNLTIGGATQTQICEILEIDLKTLRKNYRNELDTGASKANGQVVGALFKMATSGECPAATIFWAKTRMGWREKTPEHDVNRPITLNIGIERAETRPSELRRIAEREALEKKKKANE